MCHGSPGHQEPNCFDRQDELDSSGAGVSLLRILWSLVHGKRVSDRVNLRDDFGLQLMMNLDLS